MSFLFFFSFFLACFLGPSWDLVLKRKEAVSVSYFFYSYISVLFPVIFKRLNALRSLRLVAGEKSSRALNGAKANRRLLCQPAALAMLWLICALMP
jgi:hypothetical protein